MLQSKKTNAIDTVEQTVKNIIYSLNKYLMRSYYMPAMVLGEDIAMSKAGRCLKSIIIWVCIENVTLF